MDYEKQMQWRLWKAFFYMSSATLMASTIYFFQNTFGYYNFITVSLAIALAICVIFAFITSSIFYVLAYGMRGSYSGPVSSILTYGFVAGCIVLSFFESKWIMRLFV